VPFPSIDHFRCLTDLIAVIDPILSTNVIGAFTNAIGGRNVTDYLSVTLIKV